MLSEEPDLTRELDAAEEIVMGRVETVRTEWGVRRPDLASGVFHAGSDQDAERLACLIAADQEQRGITGALVHAHHSDLRPVGKRVLKFSSDRRRWGTVTTDSVWDDRQILGSGELALFLGGSPDSFTGKLLEYRRQGTDPENRGRLKIAFPRQVLAWEQWQSCSPAPTFAQMRELMANVEPRADRIEQLMQASVRPGSALRWEHDLAPISAPSIMTGALRAGGLAER